MKTETPRRRSPGLTDAVGCNVLGAPLPAAKIACRCERGWAYTQLTMKYLAWAVAGLILCAGLLGIVAPEQLLALRSVIASQTGLLVVAVIRIAIGIVLIMNAPASRAPKLLQYAG